MMPKEREESIPSVNTDARGRAAIYPGSLARAGYRER